METGTYVLFELAGATYALPSETVQHIEMIEHVTKVPNAHPAIDGVVFSRGQVLPALNLRVRFGFPRAEYGLQTRLIFVRLLQRTVGLVVDRAREFRRIPEEQIRPIEETLAGISGNYLKGVLNTGGKLLLFLDLEAVLNLENDQPLTASLAEITKSAVADKQETRHT